MMGPVDTLTHRLEGLGCRPESVTGPEPPVALSTTDFESSPLDSAIGEGTATLTGGPVLWRALGASDRLARATLTGSRRCEATRLLVPSLVGSIRPVERKERAMTKTRQILVVLVVTALLAVPVTVLAGPVVPLVPNTCVGFRSPGGQATWKVHVDGGVKGTGYAAGIPFDVETTLPNGNGLSFLGTITATGKFNVVFPGSSILGPSGTVQIRVYKNNGAHPLLCSNTVQLVA